MKLIRTDKNEFWKEEDISFTKDEPDYEGVFIRIDNTKKFQKHLGFGGAFTQAVSYLINKENNKIREEFINAYFSMDGLRYTLGRLPIHSCDFSPNTYTYIDENDKELKTFDISCDYPRLNLVKECMNKAGKLWLMTTPWSPCAFMKDNEDMSHGGKLLKEYYHLWTKYQVKFIKEVENYGIPVQAMSIQNEPAAVQVWESCIFSGKEEGIFIKDYLVPELKKNNMEKKILIWDHNRDLIVKRAEETFSLDGVEDYVWGLAYHWYCSEKYSNLTQFHHMYPNKHLLLTECCVETAWDSSTGKSSKIGIWEHGERYGKQIINDFNNYSEGYIDWNLILNQEGGPNHVGNFCEAPLIIDENTHKISFMPSYYYIGHFSRYIVPGDIRVLCESDDEMVLGVSYLNKKNENVIVIMNISDKKKNIHISINEKRISTYLNAHSIITIY